MVSLQEERGRGGRVGGRGGKVLHEGISQEGCHEGALKVMQITVIREITTNVPNDSPVTTWAVIHPPTVLDTEKTSQLSHLSEPLSTLPPLPFTHFGGAKRKQVSLHHKSFSLPAPQPWGMTFFVIDSQSIQERHRLWTSLE